MLKGREVLLITKSYEQNNELMEKTNNIILLSFGNEVLRIMEEKIAKYRRNIGEISPIYLVSDGGDTTYGGEKSKEEISPKIAN